MTDDAGDLGPTLNALGVRHDAGEEFITDAVVILKTVDGDGKARLALAWSEGMSWIERVGMLRTAEQLEISDVLEHGERDA